MKRFVLWSALAVSLLVLQPAVGSIADEKTTHGWRSVKGVEMLRLWEQPSGPKVPQVVILRLSNDQLKELEKDPLGFYKTFDVFTPPYSDHDQGHAVFNLQADPKSEDGVLVVAVHDVGTYSAYAGFQYKD